MRSRGLLYCVLGDRVPLLIVVEVTFPMCIAFVCQLCHCHVRAFDTLYVYCQIRAFDTLSMLSSKDVVPLGLYTSYCHLRVFDALYVLM